MSNSDITAIQTALRELQSLGGPKAEASLTIKGNQVFAHFLPLGFGLDTPCVLEFGDSPLECIATAHAKWEEMSDRVRSDTIKKIALAVIRITHEQGQCTDSALRAEFHASDVAKYCDEAISIANTMADNGPFEIVELQGANAA